MLLSRLLGWVLMGSLIAIIVMVSSFSFGVGAGFMNLIRADWLIFICFLMFVHAFAALGSAKALEQVRYPALMQWGLVAALMSFLGCLMLILYGFRLSPMLSELLAKAIVAGLLGALWCGQFGALYRIRRATWALKITRGLTMALASAFVVVMIWGIWWERFSWPVQDDLLLSVLLTFLALVIFGAIAGKVLAQAKTLEGVELEDIDPGDIMPFFVVCPRCEEVQSLMTGKSQCAACGLNVDVIVP